MELMASILPSFSPDSAAFGFCHAARTMVDSRLQNLEESEESSDDNDDGDYLPGGNECANSRVFRAKYAPQAVVEWYMIALDKSGLKKSIVKKDALGHLLTMGWKTYYAHKKTKRELRYKSPTGRVYVSLRTACKAYIDSQTGKKDSCRVGKRKEIAFLRKQKDDSQRFKSPVAVKSSSKKMPPRPAEAASSASSHRNPRTALSCLIDRGIVLPGDRVYYKLTGEVPLAWGRITNQAIVKCDCCSHAFNISRFEAHAGSTKRRPAANIFLEDGRSLLDCQMQLNNQTKTTEDQVNSNGPSDNLSDDKNDSVCSVCHFGGELILCDQCPAAFHGSCLGFKAVPFGEWFCPSCCCKICGQGTYDYNGVGVSSDHHSDGSFVQCVQCEQNVHFGCVKSIRVLDDDPSQNIDRENWFCTKKCENIHMGLQKLLWKQIQIPVGEEENKYLTWTLMKSCPDAAAGESNRRKLNLTLSVMHESFRPVKDPITKNDLLEDVVFSRSSEVKRLNFGGFYMVVLEEKNKVITAATVRVYGEDVAEVPFVATRLKHRRHGMCRALMNELERQLINLGVKRLTLPAVPKALKTWTSAFGFSRMTESDRSELVKYTFLSFQHSVMCQKLLTKTTTPAFEWRPWKRLKQPVMEDEISDSMCYDGWSSISESAGEGLEGGLMDCSKF